MIWTDEHLDRLATLRRGVHADDVVLTDAEIDELARLEAGFREHCAGLQQNADGSLGGAMLRLREGRHARPVTDAGERGAARIAAALARR